MGSIDSRAEMLPNHPAVAGGPRRLGGAAPRSRLSALAPLVLQTAGKLLPLAKCE